MTVIPALNPATEAEFHAQLRTVQQLIRPGDWIHLDVSDGKFTPRFTWAGPHQLRQLLEEQPHLQSVSVEVHLMIENPEDAAARWVTAGARRLIVHAEAVTDFERLQSAVQGSETEIMIATKPETELAPLSSLLNHVESYQVLAVDPGLSGQAFIEAVIPKIEFLRKTYPSATIEVDGGVTPETAKLCRDAGADTVVSSSFILKSKDPHAAFTALARI